MRIGIMGGTFNPPHMGHINAARAAKKAASLDKIIFIPAGIPPHKAMARDSATTKQRLDMTRLAAECAGAEVSDIEILREGKSFTVDTLRELKKIYPDDELWLIMGTDMFLSVESWREYENIFRLARIVAVPRDEKDLQALFKHSEYLAKRYGASSKISETKAVTISSSELRPEIGKAELMHFLPEEVYKYIRDNKLYGQSGRDGI